MVGLGEGAAALLCRHNNQWGIAILCDCISVRRHRDSQAELRGLARSSIMLGAPQGQMVLPCIDVERNIVHSDTVFF